MKNNIQHRVAQRFRESDGTARLEETLNKAVRALFDAEIPHLVAGGYAAQQHGSLRHTDNVDLIVPDVAWAFAVLRENGFSRIVQPKQLWLIPKLCLRCGCAQVVPFPVTQRATGA
jgi:hypothetical protein